MAMGKHSRRLETYNTTGVFDIANDALGQMPVLHMAALLT